MVLLLAFLLVLLLFGLGFTIHFLWIAAVVFLILWLVGFAVGRGESAGTHRFYRWPSVSTSSETVRADESMS